MPQSEIDMLRPLVRREFLKWNDFLHNCVIFNMPDSEIHATGHCERVLLYALVLGERISVDCDSLVALAHAAVFHDTRRLDDYLDTGHGARAAVYYADYCRRNPGMKFYPEAAVLMRYHDLDDFIGRKAIEKEFGGDAQRVLTLFEIFKDADALDRRRLGRYGLDTRYLRTREARGLVDYAVRLVEATVDPGLLARIEEEVNKTMSPLNDYEESTTDS